MTKANKEIREQFDFFTSLINEPKIIPDDKIQLESKSNNTYWLTGKSKLQQSIVNGDIILIVERSKRDNKYGVKLRCTALTDEPFFRFDSDGPAHRNDDPKIPLEEQSVSTPHFNTYDNLGKSIAYKSEALKRKEASKIISNDINFGVSLFCMESNCKLKNDEFPSVIDKSPEIDFKESISVNFDNITFE